MIAHLYRSVQPHSAPQYRKLCIYAALFLSPLFAGRTLHAGDERYPGLKLDTGKQIYEAACVACHGPAGEGMPEATIGFKKPATFPDFTRCDQTTSELNTDYKAVIVHGGPFRGFSQIMPAYGEAFTSKQIDEVIDVFLRSRKWLLPLLLFSAVLTSMAADKLDRQHPDFQTSDRCIACHNGLTIRSGRDVSIGFDWRSSIMANAAGAEDDWEDGCGTN